MKAAVFAYSRQGCRTARRILAEWDAELRVYTIERFGEEGFLPIRKEVYGESFAWADAVIFIGSCGIAVREIAPYVKDKRTDPAVICIDELGEFVIPLLSGHIGGANELARYLAKRLNGTPVITTATDINRKFSVDTWAVSNGFTISSMKAAKEVSAAILERDVPLTSDFPVISPLPPGVRQEDSGELGIYLTYQKTEPFVRTLRLIPKALHLGIGCRRGTEQAAVREAVDGILQAHSIDPCAVKCVASIDLKAQEQGLLDFCAERNWPVRFYTAEELRRVPGVFSASAFVQSITGVDNVCERAALNGADRLIVKKTARSGVTVAVAMEALEVDFGKTECSGHWPRKL